MVREVQATKTTPRRAPPDAMATALRRLRERVEVLDVRAVRDDADVARRRQTISGRLRSEHPHRARRFAADRPPTDDRGSRDRRRRRRRSPGRVETRRFARARSLAAPSSARRLGQARRRASRAARAGQVLVRVRRAFNASHRSSRARGRAQGRGAPSGLASRLFVPSRRLVL